MAAKPRHSRGTAHEACTDSQAAQRGADGATRVQIITPPAPPPLTITEAQWQCLVTDLATACGWQWYHTHDSRRSPAGFPDLVLARPGRLLFVELKTERGRVSHAQRVWEYALRQAGAEWVVWRPRHWRYVVATLTAEEA